MAEAETQRRLLNPFLLHMQKLGLELKCPLCLDLLRRALWLPCDHVVCSSCLSGSREFESKCPVCKLTFQSQDVRSALFMENMVSIYKCMESAFHAYLLCLTSQVQRPDAQMNFANNIGSGSACKLSREQKSIHTESQINPNSCKSPLMSLLCGKKDTATVEKQTKFNGVREERKTDQSKSGAQVSVSSGKEASLGDEDPISSLNFWLENLQGLRYAARGKAGNQQEQTSLGSPPPVCDAKDSDDDSNNRGILHGPQLLPERGLGNEGTRGGNIEADDAFPSFPNTDASSGVENLKKSNINRRSSFYLEEDHPRELKRQKLDSELHDLLLNARSSIEENPTHICVFCQSYKSSKATGEMLHYANGEAVTTQQANISILHVHKRCAEWAPQVYFDGGRVMNLEAEVARGAKIKCNGCGKKGAALGCYAKSCRRSYHIPCSAQIDECRWDDDNFLMLCPVHSSLKFPSEKSKSGKKRKEKLSSAPMSGSKPLRDFSCSPAAESSEACADPSAAKWVLCGSALSAAEKDMVHEFAKVTGATVRKNWDPNVTHIISSTDDTGACNRTLKILMGILHGKWILTIDWIKAGLDAKHPVSEEPYEVTRDIYGCCDGPKNGRQRISDKAPKLFSGVNFYLTDGFESSYKGYLEDLITAAGGTIMENQEDVTRVEATFSTTIVVYCLDEAGKPDTKELSSVIEGRQEAAEALASGTGAWVAGHTWLLDSIAACKLLPLVS